MRQAFQVGIVRALDFFPLYENALRAREGASLADGQAESARHVGRDVAASRPTTRTRGRAQAVSEAELLDVGPANRMVVFPYSKLLTANPFVNQGAAVLVADDDTARRSASPRTGGCTWSVPPVPTSPPTRGARRLRPQPRAPGRGRPGAGAHRAPPPTTTTTSSCTAASRRCPSWRSRVLGPLRPASVSVAGGLTFFGGPGSNYMTHGLASMVDRLRAGGGTGFLHGVGMFMTKHHVVVLGDRPRAGRVRGRRRACRRSPASTSSTTTRARRRSRPTRVMYTRDGSVERGVVIGRGAGGERFAARVGADDATTASYVGLAARSSRWGLPGRSGSATMEPNSTSDPPLTAREHSRHGSNGPRQALHRRGVGRAVEHGHHRGDLAAHRRGHRDGARGVERRRRPRRRRRAPRVRLRSVAADEPRSSAPT